jgi:ABC-type transport system involved in cytochrome c biogenesis permease component
VSGILCAVGLVGLLMTEVFDDGDAWKGVAWVSGAALWVATVLRVGVQASSSLAEAKRDGSLEFLLTTPLSADEMMRGYVLALWRTVRIGVFCFAPFFIAAIVSSAGSLNSAPLTTASFVLSIPLSLVTFASVGMWMGLTARNRAVALVLTLVLGWLVPSMLCILMIPAQVALTLRGFFRTKEILNRIRTGGYPADLRSYLPLPRTARENIPPVIRGGPPAGG